LTSSGPDISDEEILAMIAGEDTAEYGFRCLMEKYQERLYRHIRRLVLEHEDANDVLQNCFIKAFRGIGGFKQQSQLFTWLYRIATNESITFLKKKRRRQAAALDEGNLRIAEQLRADPYFKGEEIQRHLQEALHRLPDKQRIVFNLRYFEELSYREMSKLLDTSVGALKASYHHAVKKIECYFHEMEIR